jgi:hypothetical protein
VAAAQPAKVRQSCSATDDDDDDDYYYYYYHHHHHLIHLCYIRFRPHVHYSYANALEYLKLHMLRMRTSADG